MFGTQPFSRFAHSRTPAIAHWPNCREFGVLESAHAGVPPDDAVRTGSRGGGLSAGLWLVICLSLVLPARLRGEDEPELQAALPELPSIASLLWDADLTLRTWGGYNDNPRLSPVNRVGSGFLAGGVDLLVYRLPLDGTDVSFFGTLEHVLYINDEIDPETIGLVDARYKRTWNSGWSAGGSVDYAFLHQIFDATDLEGFPTVVRAEAHSLEVKPSVARALDADWRLELEFGASREWIIRPLDSFWDLGPRLALTRRLPRDGETGISYRFRDRRFDTRPPRASDASALPGTLSFAQHEFEVFWKQRWGTDGRFRTTLSGGVLMNGDNGGGFYDYTRYFLDAGLRYVAPRWEVRADARLRWYFYSIQPASLVGGASRHRADVSLTARAEWTVHKGVRVFGEYAVESSDENGPAGDYRMQSISAGFSLEM